MSFHLWKVRAAFAERTGWASALSENAEAQQLRSSGAARGYHK